MHICQLDKNVNLGYRWPSFILIEWPLVGGERLSYLPTNIAYLYRFLHHGKIYGFRATISKTMLDPVPMVFLDHPEVIEEMNLRKDARIHTSLPAEISSMIGYDHQPLPMDIPSTLLDMSTTGCKLITGDPRARVFNLGTVLLLSFDFPLVGNVDRVSFQLKSINRSTVGMTLSGAFGEDLDSGFQHNLGELIKLELPIA